MSNHVNFNLDEESEIEFKLSIKGTADLPNTPPIMRFIISENSQNAIAVALPVTPTEEGVTIKVPPLKHIFSETKEYVGKLEIIIGNKYFAPTEMNIGFSRSLQIEAEPVIKEAKQSFEDIPDDILESLEIKDPKPIIENKTFVSTPPTIKKKDPPYKKELKNLIKKMF